MNDIPQATFNWHIDEDYLWPPRGRPKPPFGPTAIEVMRSCTLRVYFDFSKGYERRTAYAARVGIAFHQTLQSLTEHPITSSVQEEIVNEASRRFREALARQDAQKSMRPREQMFIPKEERIQRALESIAVEALRLAKHFSQGNRLLKSEDQHADASSNRQFSLNIDQIEGNVMVEVPVQSQDGLLAGRIDYTEKLSNGGIRLLDYKSALRDDVPERYERQLQMYALLWYETFGEWPVEALVAYPFTGVAHKVAIDPATCQQVGQEARLIAKKLQQGLSAEQLATPGTVCTVCEFRPWCKPFWRWQTNHSTHSQALENAVYGFEGTILTLEQKGDHWKVIVKWRDAEIRIVAPQERFPQLKGAVPGMHIRALDMRLQGQRYRPQAIVTENSEIFLVE